MSDSLQPHGPYSPWNSAGQNTGVGSLSLFQGIFPTQELNPGLLHYRRILYQLSHKGSPQTQRWSAFLQPSPSLLRTLPLPAETTSRKFKLLIFPDSSVGKESACNAGDPGLIPWWGRSTGEGIGYPLQYSWASLVAQLVKNPPAMQDTWV